MAVDIDWEKEGVRWEFRGHVSRNELISSITSVYGDARFDTVKYKLVDLTQVEQLDIDKQGIILLACQHKAASSYAANIRNALVIRENMLPLAEQFASILGETSWDVRIFDDFEQASHWLGRKIINTD